MKKIQLKENDLLSAKVLSYSAAAGALLALGQNAEAQVSYTNVDPDSVVVSTEGERDGIFEIDMDNNGTVDVTIVHGNGDWWGSFASVRASNGSGASIATVSSYLSAWTYPTYYFARRFDQDELIGSDATFGTYYTGRQLGWYGTGTGTASPYTTGQWADGEPDKYLGIRFSLDGGTTYHYGWVRLDVPILQSEVTVKDYAYEQTADVAIAAGDKGDAGVSVRDGLVDDLGVKVFAHQRNIIVSDVKADLAQADVYNVTGQLVRSVQVESGRTEIPMDNKGLYIVRIDVEGEIVSSKVIVQ